MIDFIWLLPTFPLLGFLSLVLTGGNMPKKASAWIGAGSVGLSFMLAAIIAVQFLGSGEEFAVRHVWTWMAVGD
ncbi:MAG: NADH-quinone oxidoreductase subunit L, partial [Gammaproteobacteria bacterium]|nr:NADH-quinone oxidoreductase subunit L [Gammaproteobacteria bacterium]